jgi:alpha-L-fucosidase
MTQHWFADARYGMFIHYGVYSLLGRGEWVLNKEQIPIPEYKKLANKFTAEKLDFDYLLSKARNDWGMRYATLTTKHQEGFCLFDSKLTDFKSTNSGAKRDIVAEFVKACRKHDLKISLYFSLNDLTASPDAVDALERPEECYQQYIDYVHGQCRELLENYGKIDVLWYDGWWPFDGKGWQGEKLNAMARKIQPHILVNGRCGVPGDFDTPEQHLASSNGMWEACMTLNNNWGFHAGDHNWKSPKDVAEMLRKVAAGCGNLLLNVGPRGDGSIPEETIQILDKVGAWLKTNGRAIYGSDRFEFDLRSRGNGRSDWTHHGLFTANGNAFYMHIHSWPGRELVLTGLECKVSGVNCLATGRKCDFSQNGGKLIVTGLPDNVEGSMPVVLEFLTTGSPCIYRTGGYKDPQVAHCHYDPVSSDMLN